MADALDESTIDEALASGARKPRYGDVLEIAIERFDERGRAVGAWRDHVVRVRHGVPGERVRAKVLRRRRADVDAVVIERLVASPHAVDARCAHFPACGGCSLQDLAYEAQLAGKHRLVVEAFEEHRVPFHAPIEPVIGARERFAYRNKMELTFGARRWIAPDEPQGADAGFALGLHAAELYSKVIDVRACPIQTPVADAIVASARELAKEHGLDAWDVRAHRGLLRHLAFRCTRATREVLVNLVTSEEAPERVLPYVRAMLARHPEITTLVQSVTARAAQVAIGEREIVLHGPGFVIEELDGVRFAISASSFFQTNSAQAAELFRLVRHAADLRADDVVHDLYCGTGAIGLVLARSAGEVVGFEQVASAVRDARRNAELNRIANARFVEGDVLDGLARESASRAPDVVIVDPPRAGLHKDVPARIAASAPRRIVYVSCNPRSGARDVAMLAELGYRALSVRPIDLFPHTPHVECVVTLARSA